MSVSSARGHLGVWRLPRGTGQRRVRGRCQPITGQRVRPAPASVSAATDGWLRRVPLVPGGAGKRLRDLGPPALHGGQVGQEPSLFLQSALQGPGEIPSTIKRRRLRKWWVNVDERHCFVLDKRVLLVQPVRTSAHLGV